MALQRWRSETSLDGFRGSLPVPLRLQELECWETASMMRPGGGHVLGWGPAQKNYPLYIRSVPTENELKFHYMVHTSLDVVDEKISAMGKALVDQRELYLGLLYPTEDYKVYGYVTNSKVKFVMVVDSSNTALRDNEIRSMFRKLHNSYTDVMCNPFYNPGDRIQSRAFDGMVTSMMIPVC
ncbi:trafficking protein particle complex subunit 2-like protein isoform X1 [Mesoplodon densirostris]|uniref:trafficking protein particle complex subunit 2-like protein isoform X1 n=1 Tax=Mesoplodon densirostris TaxID=48708 RepID=UPI0028DB8A7F|nr:trafficking protein particle complex subunit 2-like protein isoform X1 [Mesoplodon densirostris]